MASQGAVTDAAFDSGTLQAKPLKFPFCTLAAHSLTLHRSAGSGGHPLVVRSVDFDVGQQQIDRSNHQPELFRP